MQSSKSSRMLYRNECSTGTYSNESLKAIGVIMIIRNKKTMRNKKTKSSMGKSWHAMQSYVMTVVVLIMMIMMMALHNQIM